MRRKKSLSSISLRPTYCATQAFVLVLKEAIMWPKVVAPSYRPIFTLAQPFHRQLPLASLPEYERPIRVKGTDAITGVLDGEDETLCQNTF